MTSHNEDKGHWHGDIHDGKMHFELPDATSTSHNEAQKTNEEIMREYDGLSSTRLTNGGWLTREFAIDPVMQRIWLTTILTLKDTQHATERADWLRSEIEKLEGIKMNHADGVCYNCDCKRHDQALTTIITRYKEELKVLESK